MHDFIYENENVFKHMEKVLKKTNLLAYKKLVFEIYPKLKSKDFSFAQKNGDMYIVDVPTDAMFKKVFGEIKLHFKVVSSGVKLVEISPKDYFLTDDEFICYKGIFIPESQKDKGIFKVNLINMLKK